MFQLLSDPRYFRGLPFSLVDGYVTLGKGPGDSRKPRAGAGCALVTAGRITRVCWCANIYPKPLRAKRDCLCLCRAFLFDGYPRNALSRLLPFRRHFIVIVSLGAITCDYSGIAGFRTVSDNHKFTNRGVSWGMSSMQAVYPRYARFSKEEVSLLWGESVKHLDLVPGKSDGTFVEAAFSKREFVLNDPTGSGTGARMQICAPRQVSRNLTISPVSAARSCGTRAGYLPLIHFTIVLTPCVTFVSPIRFTELTRFTPTGNHASCRVSLMMLKHAALGRGGFLAFP